MYIIVIKPLAKWEKNEESKDRINGVPVHFGNEEQYPFPIT
jgi:hypothetical protein